MRTPKTEAIVKSALDAVMVEAAANEIDVADALRVLRDEAALVILALDTRPKAQHASAPSIVVNAKAGG